MFADLNYWEVMDKDGWETGQRDDLNKKSIDQEIGAITTEPGWHGHLEGALGWLGGMRCEFNALNIPES